MSERSTLYDIVRSSGFDFQAEYETLRAMVERPIQNQFEDEDVYTLYSDLQGELGENLAIRSIFHLWIVSFQKFSPQLRGTSRSLEDFNRRYVPRINDPNYEPENLDEFILYCEYVMTLTRQLSAVYGKRLGVIPSRVQKHIDQVLKNAGYVSRKVGQWRLAVKEDEQLCAAVEQVPLDLGELMFRYRHSSSKGKLSFKSGVLTSMYKCIEPHREELRHNCAGFWNAFFNGCNNFNIRHNNVEGATSNFHEEIATLGNVEIEAYYDKVFKIGILLINALGLKDDLDAIASLRKR